MHIVVDEERCHTAMANSDGDSAAGLRQQLLMEVKIGRLVNKPDPITPGVTKYKIHSRLREGAFGTVYLCDVVDAPGKQVVAKVMENASANDETMLLVTMEVNCAMRVKHFACVELLDAFIIEDEVVVLILDFMSKGSLGRRMRNACNNNEFPDNADVEDAFCPLLLALQHIHAQHLVHRDIKPRNILIGESGMLKLSDFGCGKVIQDDALTKNWGAVTEIGTREIFAPERCLRCGYGPPADVWSLGVVMYKFIELRPPFDLSCIGGGEEMCDSDVDDCTDGRQVVDPDDGPNPVATDLADVILKHKVRRMSHNTSIADDLKGIIMSMLEKDPHNRPTVVQLLRMPFVLAMMERFKNRVMQQPHILEAERRAITQSVQESLQSAQHNIPVGINPVAVSGDVFIVSPTGVAPYTLAIKPSLEESGVDFQLNPRHVEGATNANGDMYSGDLKDCCVTLANQTYFVLRTRTSNHVIWSSSAEYWVRLLNGFSGDVYHTHADAFQNVKRSED